MRTSTAADCPGSEQRSACLRVIAFVDFFRSPVYLVGGREVGSAVYKSTGKRYQEIFRCGVNGC